MLIARFVGPKKYFVLQESYDYNEVNDEEIFFLALIPRS